MVEVRPPSDVLVGRPVFGRNDVSPSATQCSSLERLRVPPAACYRPDREAWTRRMTEQRLVDSPACIEAVLLSVSCFSPAVRARTSTCRRSFSRTQRLESMVRSVSCRRPIRRSALRFRSMRRSTPSVRLMRGSMLSVQSGSMESSGRRGYARHHPKWRRAVHAALAAREPWRMRGRRDAGDERVWPTGREADVRADG